MDGSKLIELIKTLTKEEMKSFGNYLLAYNRESSGVVSLYKYLKKLYPDFPPKKIEKEFVYNKIADKKSFDSKRMRNLMSLLYLDLEKFLLGMEVNENEIERDFLLLKIFKKRKLDKQFFLKIDQLKKKWENIPNQGIDHYFNEFKLAQLYYFHPNVSLYEKTEVNINDLSDSLDKYYVAQKLYYLVSQFHRKGILSDPNEKRKILLVDEVNKIKDNELFQSNIHIEILGGFLDAYINKDFSKYNQLKNIYFSNIDLFSAIEQQDLFILLENHCNVNYLEGKPEFLKEIFELNKFVVEKNIILDDDIIANEIFRGVVQRGCSAKEFEWVRNFIDTYQNKLDEEKRADVVSLCRAILAFALGQFEETLQHLNTVKFQDALFGIQARCLMLQSYYELENCALESYEDAFINLSNAFSVFLSRNEMIAENVKKGSLNFIRFSKKLFNEKFAVDNSIPEIKKDMTDCVIVFNKNWLIEKVEELSRR